MDYVSINSRTFSIAKLIKTGVPHTWTDYNIRFKIEPLSRNEISLNCRSSDGSEIVQAPIRITEEGSHGGRLRTLFNCPCCQRVVALLYLHSDQIKCWKCYGLKRTATSRQTRSRAI